MVLRTISTITMPMMIAPAARRTSFLMVSIGERTSVRAKIGTSRPMNVIADLRIFARYRSSNVCMGSTVGWCEFK